MTTETEQPIETDTDRAIRVAEELQDAGEDPYRPAAAMLADLPFQLRYAVLNELNGAAWGTVESRRHGDTCHCPRCHPEAHADCGEECTECRRVDPMAATPRRTPDQ